MRPTRTINDTERIAFIVNPKSGGGRTSAKVSMLRNIAAQRFKNFNIFETLAPNHAEKLAGDAARNGFDIIAAVGGDGTASEVVNGLLPGGIPISEKVVFTVIPGGTGSDLIKTLNIPNEMTAAIDVAANGETRKCDVMTVSLTDEQTGMLKTRVCINLVGFCSNGEVVARVNRSSKRWGGTATFFSASLRTALTYRPPSVHLEWSTPNGEKVEHRQNILAAFLANGQFGGGGMWVAPKARMDSGSMQMILIPKLSTLRLLRYLPKLYSGTAGSAPGISEQEIIYLKARALEGDRIRVDVDGEQPGILPAEFSVCPKVLNIRALWG